MSNPIVSSVVSALVAGIFFGGGTVSCRHARVTEIEGRSAFKFVQPPPPPGSKTPGELAVGDLSQRYVPAKPLGRLVPPVYPAPALGRMTGPAVVGVRITVDVNGRVSDVATSFAHYSTPGPFASEFRAAVETALAGWRFEPAEILHLETASDPIGDFQRVKSREKVEAFAEVVFTFTATGKVDVGPRVP
jgi:hypothetical protein